MDEFHIGGRQASEDFICQLELSADDHTLDIGCGIGGTSRFVANRFGCRVTGIDLTPGFVSTGQSLCDWVGLSGQVELHQGDATAMPFTDQSFDAAFMLHVGMNITMGESATVKISNMVENIAAGRISPVEIIAIR